jgi:hypothetical protein
MLLRKMAQTALIKEAGERAMAKANPSYRPRMEPLPPMVRGILEEIKASEDPLGALSKEGLLRRGALRGLAWM